MDMLEKDEFLKTYRSINAQLRKKFVGFRQEVRRPNVTDAVDGFENLSRKQLDLGFTELSAECRLAAAQLERSVSTNAVSNNGTRQVAEYNNLYVESARTFCFTNQQLPVYECYEGAIGSTNDTCLAWFTSMEAGQTALSLNDYPNAISFFTKAFKLTQNEMEKNLSGDRLISSFICQGSFREALKILGVIQPNPRNILTQILLVLILQRCGDFQLETLFLPAIENCIQPQSLQYAIEALKLGELDETSAQEIWSYLNLDQQQLLLCLSNLI
ncbi:uncharacterized protein LOC130688558 [Daphnia carinata]|uniref:uncharacterized protein LOC130688558 n=1 Tax=Daphnia carinata TaxID=120202 RepID=UPI00257F0043|nr:uncharacterized protein LOC130688558 [Daphnia carinata]